MIIQVILMVVQETWDMNIKNEEGGEYTEPPPEENDRIK